MSKKPAASKEEGIITVRPFQFEFTVIAQVEKDGVIIDTARATDRIMEANFNGSSVQGLIDAARVALEKKIIGGG